MSEPNAVPVSEQDRANQPAREFLDGLAWHTLESEARGDSLKDTALARVSFVARTFAAVRAEEREACAKVADEERGWDSPEEIAAAIRKRSEGDDLRRNQFLKDSAGSDSLALVLAGVKAGVEAALEATHDHSCASYSELCDCVGFVRDDIRKLDPDAIADSALAAMKEGA